MNVQTLVVDGNVLLFFLFFCFVYFGTEFATFSTEIRQIYFEIEAEKFQIKTDRFSIAICLTETYSWPS